MRLVRRNKLNVMLEMVSWQQYISLVLLALAVYYGYVIIRYFPRELRRIFLLRRKGVGEPEEDFEEEGPEKKPGDKVEKQTDFKGRYEKKGFPEKPAVMGTEINKQTDISDTSERGSTDEKTFELTPAPAKPNFQMEDQPLSAVAKILSEEIKKLIVRAGREKMIREELMMALKLLLRSDPYWVLGKGPFKESINNLIFFMIENNCSIHFDADEVNGLWIR